MFKTKKKSININILNTLKRENVNEIIALKKIV